MGKVSKKKELNMENINDMVIGSMAYIIVNEYDNYVNESEFINIYNYVLESFDVNIDYDYISILTDYDFVFDVDVNESMNEEYISIIDHQDFINEGNVSLFGQHDRSGFLGKTTRRVVDTVTGKTHITGRGAGFWGDKVAGANKQNSGILAHAKHHLWTGRGALGKAAIVAGGVGAGLYARKKWKQAKAAKAANAQPTPKPTHESKFVNIIQSRILND